MSQVAAGKVAIIHYTLKNDAGETIDSSAGHDPMPYLHGGGNIVAGLEEALGGKSIGDKVDVVVPPEKGYGPRQDTPPQPVPRDAFPPDVELQVGMQFMVEAGEGYAPVWIVGVKEDSVLLDGNHPLAGATLHFSVEVVGLRDATDDEKAHGHPHGLDGTAGHHH